MKHFKETIKNSVIFLFVLFALPIIFTKHELIRIINSFNKQTSDNVSSDSMFINKVRADIPDNGGGGGFYPPPPAVGNATCSSADAY